MKTMTTAVLASLALAGCSRETAAPAGEATATTVQANAQFAKTLPLADAQGFEDAQRGLVARPTGKILAADGSVITDFDAFHFVAGDAPPTVNPSLWRHAKLNAQAGLFKVVDGVYQLRGFDLGNMTLIEGRTGWIVVDALTCRETAAAALAFARRQLGDKPVTALLFSHSHIDHFGGALGVLTPEQVRGGVPVVASAGFMEEATSENVLVGTAMGRRSYYQFGKNLERSARGMVDTGLGKGVGYGSFGVLAPTDLITQPTEERVLDGVRFVFHNVPGAEAPAEMTFSVPALKLYGGAENLAQTMHNLLPVRGAKVRDALRWAGYMQQALDQLGDAEVYVGQHNWPIWGHERIAEFITKHRDVYKYTHDQTVRLINAGLTPNEIADQIRLPASLQGYFGTRGYYGDLRHNVKAVYQFYLGAYDGNPAHLDPLPPVEMARRYVALAGGADKAVAAAQQAFDQGDYRWAVELLNHVVFADAGNRAARELLARSYDQLGYAAEAATWRNSYLTAAAELRGGAPKQGTSRAAFLDMLVQTPIERFLEAMAAGLDGPAAEGKDFKINLVLTDTKESYALWIENAVLHFRRAEPAADANATMTLTKTFFVRMMAGTAGAKDMLTSDEIKVTGSRIDLLRFLGLMDKAPGTFPIVTR
ncbi:alkyl/aryl-sulfatase [Roseateles saccharophilus]|uniref:Alkyl sulfatase BDS1-like metallo-beta-lactamase superfamily hydrolase n=1 Tax=Roseateles saccharophilus TaxID=304 RepID=A0A4R3VBD0_ROSSA|nr:alkyl sulfatase dimerization domain-containing protein [Roseateles saccharophilus]MDG0831673.1 MBL fold metallo-hydrolase [Roseateles saccharophilus]TCV00912.1 alkyl sulfatase BDS1-like metallo-beta-lactamase superfamily hydrolase [Roseateles saccharophilus]